MWGRLTRTTVGRQRTSSTRTSSTQRRRLLRRAGCLRPQVALLRAAEPTSQKSTKAFGLIIPGLGLSARQSVQIIRMLFVCFYDVMACRPPTAIQPTLSADEGGEDGEEEEEQGKGGGAAGQLEGFLGEASVPVTAAQEAQSLSAHERRMQRMAERAQRLEQQNVGEKEWFMRGEAGSGARLQPSDLSTQSLPSAVLPQKQ